MFGKKYARDFLEIVEQTGKKMHLFMKVPVNYDDS
jgi:hypothetical protein